MILIILVFFSRPKLTVAFQNSSGKRSSLQHQLQVDNQHAFDNTKPIHLLCLSSKTDSTKPTRSGASYMNILTTYYIFVMNVFHP